MPQTRNSVHTVLVVQWALLITFSKWNRWWIRFHFICSKGHDWIIRFLRVIRFKFIGFHKTRTNEIKKNYCEWWKIFEKHFPKPFLVRRRCWIWLCFRQNLNIILIKKRNLFLEFYTNRTMFEFLTIFFLFIRFALWCLVLTEALCQSYKCERYMAYMRMANQLGRVTF